jgi:hypothetical protein
MFNLVRSDRRNAQRLVRRSDRAIAAGQWSAALAANEAAEQTVRVAIAAADVPQDQRVLGSLLYNRAMILERLDEVDRAFYAASDSLKVYHDLDPTWGAPKLVRLALAGLQPQNSYMPELSQVLRTSDEDQRYRMLLDIAVPHDIEPTEAEERIGQAADARSRSQRLQVLARADDAHLAQDLFLTDANLAAPVQTYEQLLAYGYRYTSADLDRLQTRRTEIRRILHRRPE